MKKSQKTLIIVVLVVAMVVAFTACTSAPASTTTTDTAATVAADDTAADVSSDTTMSNGPKNGSTYKVGMSSSILVYNSYITIANSIAEYAQAEGWECVSTNADGDLSKQIADMEDLAAQNCDLIFLNCTDPTMLTPTINTIVENGTPIIELDTKLDRDAKVLTTITADNRTNGFLCGEWAGQKLGSDTMNAIIISGAKGVPVAEERRAGALEGFSEYAYQAFGSCHINIVGQYYTDWYADQSISAIEDALAANLDFNVIISEADVMLLPIYEELNNKGISDNYLFVSTADAQKEAIELCLTADNYCTGLNSFTQQARMGIDIAKAYFNGERSFPTITYTESACINKSNAESYYDPNAIF